MHELAHSVVMWDRSTFLTLNHAFRGPFMDWLMPAITDLGLGWVQALSVLALAVLVAWRAGEVAEPRDGWMAVYRRRGWVGPLLVAFVIAGLGSDAIKAGFSRHRPWWFYEQQHAAGRYLDVQVATVPGVYPLKVHGFPSGHTSTTVAMASVVTLLYARRRRYRMLLAGVWTLAALIAFSRVYLASHWPLDVLGGAALGLASAAASLAICRAWARSRGAAARAATLAAETLPPRADGTGA